MRVKLPLALVAALVVAPTSAHAALPKLGVDNGVRVSAASGKIRITLLRDGPVYRAVRGHDLAVRCYLLSAFPTGPAVGNAVGQTVPVARGQTRVRLTVPTRPKPSFCSLRRRDREVAAVALTHDGAVWLDERTTASNIQFVVTALSLLADHRGGNAWPSPADVQKTFEGKVALLPTPDAPAPATGIAVFSDGARHLRVSSRSSLGRELYIEYRDDALLSNAVPYLELE